MPTSLFLEAPPSFSFRHTVYSHGWSELPPFELDDQNWRLKYTYRVGAGGKPIDATISETDGGLRIDISRKGFNEKKLVRDVRHILRLDDPLDDFYQLTDTDDRLTWVSASNAGRLLRSPTVFEDMVKTLCTTNCSWALTRNMVRNLVDLLGEGSGRIKSFPMQRRSHPSRKSFIEKRSGPDIVRLIFSSLPRRSPRGHWIPSLGLRPICRHRS